MGNDAIFELPPVDALPRRGSSLRYMDGDNDSYRLTRLISALPNIMPKDIFVPLCEGLVLQIDCMFE